MKLPEGWPELGELPLSPPAAGSSLAPAERFPIFPLPSNTTAAPAVQGLSAVAPLQHPGMNETVHAHLLFAWWTMVQMVNGVNSTGTGNSTKCYGSLGCLHLTEDWFGISRPVNILPQEREIIDTKFLLNTRTTADKPELLVAENPATITGSSFDPGRETKFIIHGFIDTGFVPWCQELSKAFLEYGDYNVITVDWGGGSDAIYSQAASNTRLVALEVAALIQTILTLHDNYKTSSVHLIGHSLGSHISGYVGEALKERNLGKLGRITGLDPAEPLFQSMPEFVRLDPGDAEFVDAIHTDAKSILMFGYGMEQPVGHVDFYPNGGTDQPGCSFLDLPVSLDSMVYDTDRSVDYVKRHLVACSHTRAIYLYISSLKREKDDQCVMVARECSTYEEFKMGLCFGCGKENQYCAIMGQRAIEYKPTVERYGRRNVKFYLNTGDDEEHFCQHHYLLQLNLASPSSAERWVQGFLQASLHGSKVEATDINLTPSASVQLSHGSRKSFLLSLDEDLGRVDIVNLRWKYDHEIDPLNLTKVCVLLCSDHLFLRNVTIKSLQMPNNRLSAPPIDDQPSLPSASTPIESYVVVCGDSAQTYVELPSGESKLFYKSC